MMWNREMRFLAKLTELLSSIRPKAGDGRQARGPASLSVGSDEAFLGVRLARIYAGSLLLTVFALAFQVGLMGNSGLDRLSPFSFKADSGPAPKPTLRSSALSISLWEDEIPLIRPESTESLQRHLEEYNLWEIDKEAEIQPVVFANFPPQLKEVTADTKKRLFFHSLLPVASVAVEEIKQERLTLEAILAKIAPHGGVEDLAVELPELQGRLTREERLFLHQLVGKYQTSLVAELLGRVNVFPLSLILAQGAIESYWGTSRFAMEGNNIFGMWTWDTQGIVPLKREAGKTHRVARYGSLLESVREFILTLNRVPAYAGLREIRRETMNPLVLADGLSRYSERGPSYIKDVKNVIESNDLQKYDDLELKGLEREERFALLDIFGYI